MVQPLVSLSANIEIINAGGLIYQKLPFIDWDKDLNKHDIYLSAHPLKKFNLEEQPPPNTRFLVGCVANDSQIKIPDGPRLVPCPVAYLPLFTKIQYGLRRPAQKPE